VAIHTFLVDLSSDFEQDEKIATAIKSIDKENRLVFLNRGVIILLGLRLFQI